jgi:hypothetical protein
MKFEKIKPIIIVILILINLTPIWIFKYFPTQDGSTHIHTAQAIKDYNNPEYTKFREYYQINLSPFPNWSAQIVLILFMYVFPSLIAEKLLITVYAVLLPLSIMYMINSVNKRKSYYGIPQLMSLLFVHNFLLYMGFYNFMLSLPPCFFAIGYWWRNREKIRIKQVLIMNILIFSTYFSHIVSYGVLVILIIMLSFIYLTIECVKQYKTARKIKSIFPYIIKFAVILASITPSAILLYMYLNKSGVGHNYPSIRELIKALFPIETLYYISKTQKIIAYSVSILIILLILYTLIRDKFRIKGNILEFNLTGKDYFLLSSFTLLIIYLSAPSDMAGGGFISNRLILYPPLLLLPWISINYHKIMKRTIEGIVILLCLINISMLNYYVWKFNGVMQEFVSGVELVGNDNAIIGLIRDRMGWFMRVEPFAGGTNYYCIDRGNVNLVNYQANLIYFGINFKPNLNRPDIATLAYEPNKLDFGNYVKDVPYIVAWGLADNSDTEKNVLNYYKLITRTDKLKVFESLMVGAKHLPHER